MKRRPSQELLDIDSGTPEEVAASFIDLRWFNRWFGGIATSRSLMETVAGKTGQKSLSVLEVASGDGFVPQLLRTEFDHSGIQLKPTLLDRVPAHLPKNGALPKLAADASKLPFPNSSFDLVSSSLFVHQLAPDEVVRFAHEALRVCRIAVLTHDLIRHPLHLGLACAGRPLYRSRITRNDATASVWQAYTVDEMRGFFQAACASPVDIERHFLFRMGVIAWKGAPPA